MCKQNMDKILNIFILLTISVSNIQSVVLPPYASKYVCHQSWSNFSSCLVENTNEGIRALKGGIPEADIPPLDPYHLDSFNVTGGGIGFAIRMTMKNITIYGKGNSTVTRFVINPKRMCADIDITIPWLRMTNTYNAVGFIFGVPIVGAANFDGNFTDIRETLKFSYIRYNSNGTDYYRITTMGYKGRVGSAHIKLTALDPKKQTQVSNLEKFFNNNDRLVLDTVNLLTRVYAAKFYRDMINDVLEKVPADEILPK